jgi:hypothetical protein
MKEHESYGGLVLSRVLVLAQNAWRDNSAALDTTDSPTFDRRAVPYGIMKFWGNAYRVYTESAGIKYTWIKTEASLAFSSNITD